MAQKLIDKQHAILKALAHLPVECNHNRVTRICQCYEERIVGRMSGVYCES